MPQVFDDANHEWTREREVLQSELPLAEYKHARSTTLNAHYTSPAIIRAMYQAAERFGFSGGRIVEPACGIGHFIGLMPEEMLRRSAITGVEIDPLTARIARALYPDADIRGQPFEKSKLADSSFDLAISNVPFGDYTVHDPRWNKYKFSIHDYFFAAALDKVRPGGLVLFVTTHGTMDKLDSSLRELLGARTELLGAIRLPNDAFKNNAGTEVTTDIVMLRKLRDGESPSGPAWKAAVNFTNDRNENFALNEYFAAHPEMMLGNMRLSGRMYRDNEPTLEPDGPRFGCGAGTGCRAASRKTFTKPKSKQSPTEFPTEHSRARFRQAQRLLRPRDGRFASVKVNAPPAGRYAGGNALAHPAAD